MHTCYTMAPWNWEKTNFSHLTTIFIILHGLVG